MTHAPHDKSTLYTIGHSNHELDRFIALLAMHQITAVADVRSSPYSQYNPQFNRELLQTALKRRGIDYVFLGLELGARRAERECYLDGKVDYGRVMLTPAFVQGLERIRQGVGKRRIALMCAEKDPLECHRTILVCRALRRDDLDIRHILEDGCVESSDHAEERLLSLTGLPSEDLFRARNDLIESAYEKQGGRIAYVEEPAARDIQAGAT